MTDYLSIKKLEAYYGESKVLHGIDLEVRQGEIVTLLGRNGAGKSTTLKAIMGMIRTRTGQVSFQGVDTIAMRPEQIGRRGVAYCPEDRGIFASLNVYENLLLPPMLNSSGMAVKEIFRLFPNIEERLDSPGARLSGGEQQMLAIARILRTGARLLLLDEPTEGLAPVIVKRIAATLQAIKARGYTILLVEQALHFASDLGDRHYILEEGKVVDHFDKAEIKNNTAKVNAYLGV